MSVSDLGLKVHPTVQEAAQCFARPLLFFFENKGASGTLVKPDHALLFDADFLFLHADISFLTGLEGHWSDAGNSRRGGRGLIDDRAFLRLHVLNHVIEVVVVWAATGKASPTTNAPAKAVLTLIGSLQTEAVEAGGPPIPIEPGLALRSSAATLNSR